MEKIMIVTFNNADNYGAKLQEYALQKFLQSNNYYVSVLNYNNKLISSQYKLFKTNGKTIGSKVKSIIKSILFLKANYLRRKSFIEFDKKNINLTVKCNKVKEVEKIAIQYDYLIAGSDQIWNPKITGVLDDVYTLNFKWKNGKRISYAASVGDSTFIQEYLNEFKRKISKLDYISVREVESQKELHKVINKNITTVIDPIFLLESDDWNELIDTSRIIKDKYIFTYMVEEDSKFIKFVNEFSKKTNLRIIHFDQKNKNYNNILKKCYTKGPQIFLNLLLNAEYVITTSFHATAFSVLYHKNFYVFPHKKTGGRVINLLSKLELIDRIQKDNTFIEKKIDWNIVDKKLYVEKEKSKNWIINNLKG